MMKAVCQAAVTQRLLDIGTPIFVTEDLDYEHHDPHLQSQLGLVTILYPQQHVYCDFCAMTETHAHPPPLLRVV